LLTVTGTRTHTTMKIPLFITLLALGLCASSCRTYTPLDPMTMEPSERCLPGHEVIVIPTK
jgi:hypothetical protein